MLAYSTISHMGFLLLGILRATKNGYSSGMFYILSYVLMTLASFGMIMLLSRAGFEADRLDDFKGLNQRSPWYAFMMLLVMFSHGRHPAVPGLLRQARRAGRRAQCGLHLAGRGRRADVA